MWGPSEASVQPGGNSKFGLLGIKPEGMLMSDASDKMIMKGEMVHEEWRYWTTRKDQMTRKSFKAIQDYIINNSAFYMSPQAAQTVQTQWRNFVTKADKHPEVETDWGRNALGQLGRAFMQNKTRSH